MVVMNMFMVGFVVIVFFCIESFVVFFLSFFVVVGCVGFVFFVR